MSHTDYQLMIISLSALIHPTLTGRVARMSKKLAVPGEYFHSSRHQEAAPCRVQDVPQGGQVLEGDNGKSQEEAQRPKLCHTTWYMMSG